MLGRLYGNTGKYIIELFACYNESHFFLRSLSQYGYGCVGKKKARLAVSSLNCIRFYLQALVLASSYICIYACIYLHT